MYCKNCGKQITDDSKFCKFCGTLVEGTIPMNISNITKEINSEVMVTSKEKSTSKNRNIKTTTTKETFANEVVANLKMVGIAIVLWAIYVLGFICIHFKDTKPMNENSWYGESCYDPSYLSGHCWMMDWQNQYAINVLTTPDFSKQKKTLTDAETLSFALNFIPLDQCDYNIVWQMSKERALDYANGIAKNKKLPNEIQGWLKQRAMEAAQKDKEDFWNTITSYRKNGYKNDLHKHMKWAAIIVLSLTILGRYFIKSWKWIVMHKSK